MRRRVLSRSRPSEQGFTLVEVLIGMAILSILGVGVWSGVTVALRTAERFHARALANARLLQLDDRFRECAGRILAPWWISGPSLSTTGGSWSVAWLDGDPKRKLVLSFSEGVLSVDDGAYVSRYPGLSSASLAAGLDGRNESLGMTLTVEGKDIGHKAIVARYGSAPVRTPEGS